MKYCPNEACSYAVRFKRPAEFRDQVTTCTECGAALGEAPVRKKVEAAPLLPSDAGRRLAVTAAAFVATLLALQVPLLSAGSGLMAGLGARSGTEGDPYKVLAFGLTPFLTGFLVVEVVAWLVPSWNARRVGTLRARAPLVRAAVLAGVVFLLLQTAGMVRFLTSDSPWDSPYGLGMRPNVGSPESLWAQYLAAHLALLALALAVSRWGLGNGFAVLVGALSSGGVVAFGLRCGVALKTASVSAGVLLLLLSALAGAAVLTVRLSTASRRLGKERPSAAPFPVSGLGLFAVGSAVLSVPASLGFSGVSRALTSSSLLFYGLSSFIAVDAALVLGFLFFRPAAVGRLWKRWHPDVDEAGVVARARALLPQALALTVAASVLVPLGFSLWSLVGSVHLGVPVLEVMVLTLVLLDLREEVAARQRLGLLVPVRPLQRLAEVEPVLRVLEQAGIAAHAQSAAYRASQQFFGPQTPVVILVPQAQAEAARKLLDVD